MLKNLVPTIVGMDLLLLVTVLSQTLLALVSSHLVFLSFFTAWHNNIEKLFKVFEIRVDGCVNRLIRSHLSGLFKLCSRLFLLTGVCQ